MSLRSHMASLWEAAAGAAFLNSQLAQNFQGILNWITSPLSSWVGLSGQLAPGTTRSARYPLPSLPRTAIHSLLLVCIVPSPSEWLCTPNSSITQINYPYLLLHHQEDRLPQAQTLEVGSGAFGVLTAPSNSTGPTGQCQES